MRTFPTLLGIVVVAVAALVLLGWTFDLALLRGVLPGLPPMVPWTAVIFLLQGASVVGFARAQGRPLASLASGRALAVAGLAVPLLVLVEYALDRPLGFDVLLFRDAVTLYTEGPYPGRVSPHTAVALLCSGLALLSLRASPRRGSPATQVLAITSGALALVALVGHLHGVVLLFGVSSAIGLSLPSVVCLLSLACALLALTPEQGLMHLVLHQGGAGLLARRLLVASVALPLLLAALLAVAVRVQVLNLELGHAVFVVASVGMFAALVVRVARDVAAAEAARVELATTLAARVGQERLEQAARVAQFGIFEIDHGTRAVVYDAIARQHLGLGPDERVDLATTLEHVHPEDRAGVEAAFQRAQDPTGDGVLSVELRVVAPNDEVRWSSARGQTAFEGEGAGRRAVRTVGAIVDVTDHKQVEAEARDRARRTDEFLATLAHELRNPLAPIRTGIQLVKRCPSSANATAALAVMDRQLGHMVRLIDDLLDVSRITRGLLVLHKARVELHCVVDLALEQSRPILESGGQALSVHLPTTPIWLEADLTRLAQILTNLLNNAARYTPREGHIEVRADYADGHVLLSVRDDGVGIAAHQLPTIFDMFIQADPSVTRTNGGLGIGLSLVKRLAELHGGTVQAESAGPGSGSTFTVCLPALADVAQAGAPGPATEVGARGRQRVLVVDDNQDAADLLKMTLDLLGHETKAVYSGADALRVVGELRPQLVLCDIGMPGLSGHDVARSIRSDPSLATTMLVALTGWGSVEDRARALEAGFDDHLTKPVGTDEVEEVLARVADRLGT